VPSSPVETERMSWQRKVQVRFKVRRRIHRAIERLRRMMCMSDKFVEHDTNLVAFTGASSCNYTTEGWNTKALYRSMYLFPS
jgi:hypothetical protein